MIVWTTIFFLTWWTVPVLSGVLQDSGNHEIDTSNQTDTNNIFIKDQVVNNSSDIKHVNVSVNMSESHHLYSRELKEEGRKKKKPDIMTRILPMMIIPFMLQTAIIPMILTMLKIMLIKSAFIGKMAIILGFINMFRVATNKGGVYTHNIHLGHEHMDHLAEEHYGYKGDEEYGAYVNRKKRSNR